LSLSPTSNQTAQRDPRTIYNDGLFFLKNNGKSPLKEDHNKSIQSEE